VPGARSLKIPDPNSEHPPVTRSMDGDGVIES
jgi:hypothetical protein